MFWNRIAAVYDFFEEAYNKKVYLNTGKTVAEFIEKTDDVLECACGTGAISVWIADACQQLVATDMAKNMLQRAAKKCSGFQNVRFEEADLTNLPYEDNRFDKVVAGNVIHLLEDPKHAVTELARVTKPGGQIILPTYINKTRSSNVFVTRVLELFGADFKRQFDWNSYKEFFQALGYENAVFRVVDGRMPCAIAILRKESRLGG